MSDSLSYADRARKAIPPSNLAVKALSIVAHHSNPQTIDDWPQVGSQRKAVDSSKKPTSDQHIVNKSNNLAFIVSKSISSPARLQPSQQPQIKSSSSSGSQTPNTPANQKVIFGSIGLETPPSLSPSPALVHPENPTKTPPFSIGLDNSNEPVPVRLKARTRPSTEESESNRINHSTPHTSAATTQTPNKWKFGTTTSTPVVNGKKPLPADEPSGGEPAPSSSSSLLFHQSDEPIRPKGRERAISFGYIDTFLPPDENVSTQTKSKAKPKIKTKTKVNPSTKSSPPVEANQLDDVDPVPLSNPVPDSPPREDRDADSDPDFKVRDFGFGFGSGGIRYTQVELGRGDTAQENETGDNPNSTSGQDQQNSPPSAGPVINDNTPQTLPIPDTSSIPPYQHGLLPHSQPPGNLSNLSTRPSRRGTFSVPRAGGYGSYNNSNERGGHERGGFMSGYERSGRRSRGGMNGYPRGYPSGRGINRGGGPGPTSSHSSPSGGGGGGHRVPYDSVTSPTLPPLPLHFSQLPHSHQQQHGMDPMYYPPPRHGGPGQFDPYQPYPHIQQSLPPHLQGYPHYQQVPPPLPPHLLASVSSTSVSASGSGGDEVPSTNSTSTSTSTSPQPPNASSSSSTSPRSSTPPSSHSSPPVPIPLTILPFPLDSTRYYLLGQLEYYLSPQNMVQDFFLRQQMDTKGYIPISLLASFNRIKQLTLDTRLVKEVLLLSAFVEVNGGMVRMGGASFSSAGGQGEGQSRSSWESFVLPDAAESVVEDVENVVDEGYGYQPQHQQHRLNGYGYGGSGYGYGYGTGYGYGYGYGYPPVGPGLGYYEDPQSQQLHQQQGGGGYEQGGSEGVDEHGHSSPHDQGEAVPSSMLNGRVESDKHDDPSVSPPKEEEKEEIKTNGVLKHGDEEEYEEEEDEEEEEDVVFVMGTDVSTSWTPERERRA